MAVASFLRLNSVFQMERSAEQSGSLCSRNDVIALVRDFTEFDSFGGRLRHGHSG